MKKKLISMALAVILCAASLTGCFSSNDQETGANATDEQNPAGDETEGKTIDTIRLYYVPSRNAEEIVTATEPLKEMLKDELKKEGYNVAKVEINVGTNFETVGEALLAGTQDVGFIPAGTYVLYEDGAEVILTATRDGLSKDYEDPKAWNDGKATEPSSAQAVSYRALLIAGPSEKGQALAAKVNGGKELTWEDLNGANWSVMSSSSSAGYIYPTLWFQTKYEKGITDLANAVQSDSYGSAFARLASGQVDVVLTYADARRDFEEKWTTDFARKNSIWKETNVIGVTDPIYNDTICVSKKSDIMDDQLKKAISKAFINIGNTEEGKKVIAIYGHQGYQSAKASDYEKEREIQKQILELNSEE